MQPSRQVRPRLAAFRWAVPDTGFTWILKRKRGGARARAWIVESLDGPTAERVMEPLEESPDLYTRFANLESTQESILEFANENGLLTAGRQLRWRQQMVRGEPGALWRREIEAMAMGFRLRHALRKRLPRLVEEILGHRRSDVYRHSLWQSLWKSSGGYNRSLHDLADRVSTTEGADEIERALFALQDLCNRRLERRTAFGVTFASQAALPSELTRAPKRLGALLPQAVPHDLLGALWLQFAESLAGTREHRPCLECGRWIPVSPDTRRRHVKYCSEACKAKAYRRRRAEQSGGE